MNGERIRAVIPEWQSASIWFCGPPRFGQALREDFLASQGKSVPACHACGKDELKDDGLASGNDEQRIVSCVSCNTLLYRYELAPEPAPAS